jgi:hypothetical protein
MAVDIESLAVIDVNWAQELATKSSFDIWQHNKSSAQQIANDIDLAGLGGLVVQVANVADPVTPGERLEMQDRRSIIDLAFEEDSYTTITSLLLAAARSQRLAGSNIVKQLTLRSQPTALHGGNELWHLPTSAILLLDSERSRS